MIIIIILSIFRYLKDVFSIGDRIEPAEAQGTTFE